MNIVGEYVLTTSLDEAWDALNDADLLGRCTPGCQSIDALEEDLYEAVAKVGIGSISGTYKGKVKFSNRIRREKYTLSAEGAGPVGTLAVTGDILFREEEDHITVAYVFQVQVGGASAGLAQRALTPIAKFLIKQFFGNVAKEIAGRAGEICPQAM